MFQENYMVLEGFLTDASSRIENLIKQAYTSYIREHQSDKKVHDRRIQEMIWIALESYIVTQLHGKVYSKIISRHRKENQMFYERCKELSSTLTPAALGLPVDYSCPYKETIEKLNTMSQQNTPIGKLYCLQETIDNIQTDVKNHFKSSLRIGEPVPLPSDDLISLLATIIVQANLNFFPSDVYYIENFHWPFSEGEKLSFVLVTVRAALEFIKSADVDKYLPTKQKKKTTLPSRVTPPIHSSLALPTVPPSLLKLHDEEEGKKEVPPLNETLEKLKRLRMIDDNIVTDRNNMSTKPEKQEGRSFFERLMFDDGVMSSVDFPSPSKS